MANSSDFYRVRSLQELSAIVVIGHVAVNKIRPMVSRNTDDCDEYVTATKASFEKLIPRALFTSLSHLVQDIAMVVFVWWKNKYEKRRFSSVIPVGEFVAKYGLRWQWCGVIDYAEMAKLIACESRFPIRRRFQLACEYSLKEYIQSLWTQCCDGISVKVKDRELPNLLKYWIAWLKGEFGQLLRHTAFRDEVEYGMTAASKISNLSSIKYFWNQMSVTERSDKLMEFANRAMMKMYNRSQNGDQAMFPFFILQMNDVQQAQFVRSLFDNDVINCLLDWPWQGVFMSMLQLARSPMGNIGSTEPINLVMTLRTTLHWDTTNPDRWNIVCHLWSELTKSEKLELLGDFFTVETTFDASVLVKTRTLFRDFVRWNWIAVAYTERCAECLLQRMEKGAWKDVRLILEYLVPKYLTELRTYVSYVMQFELKRHCEQDHFMVRESEVPATSKLKDFVKMFDVLERLCEEYVQE